MFSPPKRVTLIDANEIFLYAAALYVQQLLPLSTVTCLFLPALPDWEQQAIAAEPDFVLVDVGVPGRVDLRVLTDLRARLPQSFLVAVLLFEMPHALERARRAGADTVVLKSHVVDDLPRALADYRRRGAAGATSQVPWPAI